MSSPLDAGPVVLLPIAVRAYVTTNDHTASTPRTGRQLPGPSETTLTFDTETTTDYTQRLRFGAYQVRTGTELREHGIFYEPTAVTRREKPILRDYASEHGLRLLTREEFIEWVFFGIGYNHRASIVGFNLPFDLSRLAIGHDSARGEMKGGFSLLLSRKPWWPRIQVKHLSRRAALIRFTARAQQRATRSQRKRGDRMSVRRGFFVDVKTLASALTSESFSLATLAEYLRLPRGKLNTEEHGGRVTHEYVAYALRDVEVTWNCFIALKARYENHGLSNDADASHLQRGESGEGVP